MQRVAAGLSTGPLAMILNARVRNTLVNSQKNLKHNPEDRKAFNPITNSDQLPLAVGSSVPQSTPRVFGKLVGWWDGMKELIRE